MPELPEVETIKNDLKKFIGKSITSAVFVKDKKQSRLFKKIIGEKIVSVDRRAKMLIFGLSNGAYLISHLKMTGQWILIDKDTYLGGGHPIKHNFNDLPNKSTRFILEFSDGLKLFFNDTRGFGWVRLVNLDELKQINKKYGPEPLESSFKFKDFYALIKNKNVPIKVLLLDQKIISGIGNIYASETCFCAGVNPNRKASELDLQELKKIYLCMRKILKLAIKKRGTSSKDYVDALGRQGSMSDFLKVYQKEKSLCPRCGGKIIRISQRQRATFYCPDCQS